MYTSRPEMRHCAEKAIFDNQRITTETIMVYPLPGLCEGCSFTSNRDENVAVIAEVAINFERNKLCNFFCE